MDPGTVEADVVVVHRREGPPLLLSRVAYICGGLFLIAIISSLFIDPMPWPSREWLAVLGSVTTMLLISARGMPSRTVRRHARLVTDHHGIVLDGAPLISHRAVEKVSVFPPRVWTVLVVGHTTATRPARFEFELSSAEVAKNIAASLEKRAEISA